MVKLSAELYERSFDEKNSTFCRRCQRASGSWRGRKAQRPSRAVLCRRPGPLPRTEPSHAEKAVREAKLAMPSSRHEGLCRETADDGPAIPSPT